MVDGMDGQETSDHVVHTPTSIAIPKPSGECSSVKWRGINWPLLANKTIYMWLV